MYGNGRELESGIGFMLMRGWRPEQVTPLADDAYEVLYVEGGRADEPVPAAAPSRRAPTVRDVLDALRLVREPGASAEIESVVMESLATACTESLAVQTLLAAEGIGSPEEREWAATFAWFILDSRRGHLPGWSRYRRGGWVAA